MKFFGYRARSFPLRGGLSHIFHRPKISRATIIGYKNAAEITRHHANYKNLELVSFAAEILKFFAIRGQKNYVTLKAFTCDRAMIIAAIKGDRK